jgi:hypothetical protein
MGVLGVCVIALGALLASSARTKTAEARSSTLPALSTAQVSTAQVSTAQLSTAQLSTAQLSTAQSIVASEPAPLSTASLRLGAVTPLELITPPPADLRLENPKLRRMQQPEITKRMLEAAAKIVHEHYAKPVGTLIEVEVDGQRVIARIERHFHPEGGPVKPWGFHPGVSLYAPR